DDHGDGTASVEFAGGVLCSHATAGDIDAKAQELGPYALEPTRLSCDYDGERGELPIGSGDVPPTGRLVVIEVSWGVVREVYSDDPEARILLVDRGAEGCADDDPGLDDAGDGRGPATPVHVVEFPTAPAATMPAETRAAL